MSTSLILDNLAAYSLQIGMLVGVAAVVPTLLRLRQPGARLLYWHILLAACLVLPLQPWKQVVAGGTVQVATQVTVAQPAPHSSPAPLLPRSEMALLVLLLGMAIRLAWLAAGFWKLRRYRRHSRPLDPAPAWGVEASLRISDDVASPVTFGWRKPVVLLPAKFDQLPPQVREAILCHEILHVRRGDWLFTVLEELIRAAFWFHPAIWWLLGEISLAREQEVDRQAIEITRERDEYMDALLAIAGARPRLDLAPAPLFLRKRHLRHRVILIVKEARMSKLRIVSSLTTGFAALAAACWLVTGAFPLTAEPQVVNDAAGVTVNLNGSTLLHRNAVHYPAPALEHGVQGAVSVQLKLDSSGNVADAQVLSGPEELRRAVLESVLEWHFTRDEGGTTRVLQIEFQIPKPAAETAVVQGVAGGVSTGVVRGVIGSVPDGVNPDLANLRQRTLETRVGVSGGVPGQTPSPATVAFRLARISVTGLSEQAAADLLNSLPVHQGDNVSAADLPRISQAVQAFDEHLTVQLVRGSDAGEMNLRIVAPGSTPAASPSIKVGGNVQSAMIVSKVEPIYPSLAKSARVSGVVHLGVLIAKDGTVQELKSLGGPALLIQAAMDAVRQWVYRPTLLNGAPVVVETTVDVNFTLSQ